MLVVVADAGEAGRGYVATRACKPGTLLVQDMPLVSVVDAAHHATVCAWCLRTPAATLQRCASCHVHHYCDQGCQRRAWPGHKVECAALARLTPTRRLAIPSVLRLLALLVWDDVASARVLSELRGHRQSLSESTQEQHAQILFGLREWALAPNTPVPPCAQLLLSALVSNTFSLTNAELQSVGAGLYTALALFNHSCAPNAVAVPSGRCLQVCPLPPAVKIRQVGGAEREEEVCRIKE